MGKKIQLCINLVSFIFLVIVILSSNLEVKEKKITNKMGNDFLFRALGLVWIQFLKTVFLLGNDFLFRALGLVWTQFLKAVFLF